MIQKEHEKTDDEPIESLNIRMTEQTNTTNIILGVCYTEPDQEEVHEVCKKPHIYRPLSLQGMLTIRISAGREYSRAQAMQKVSGAHG